MNDAAFCPGFKVRVTTKCLLRPSQTRFFFRNSNTQGNADFSVWAGMGSSLPVAGKMGLGGTGFGTMVFVDGTWFVNTEIPPGTYRNSDSSRGCYWERRSGMGGTLGEIIANEFTSLRSLVTISAGDVGFQSERCGEWTSDILSITSGLTHPFRDGSYVVGLDIGPGTWRNSDSSEGCYWERRSGFGGRLEDIIANGFSTSIQTVTVQAGDAGFSTSRCGTWTKIG